MKSKFPCLVLAALVVVPTLTSVSAAFAQQAAAQKVDVMFLIDDSVSFVPNQVNLEKVVADLIVSLEAARPGVDFAFGVSRFADYGGSGWDYCAGVNRPCSADYALRINGRPFILNQDLLTATSAGGISARNAAISAAFARSNPNDWGGDDPEAILEALYQLAAGAGFDGDGDGGLTGLDGLQIAGALATQTTPDTSGDVPAYSRAGTLGSAAFRPDATKIIIVATDSCPVTAFPADTAIPETIRGRYSEERVYDFSCMGAVAGVQRFGFVGNAKSASANTVADAVAPSGAATLADTVAALNAADIRVFGLGPRVKPVASGAQEAGFDPGQWLSAIARITGGVDNQGKPRVFDLEAGVVSLREQILAGIVTVTDQPTYPGCQNVSIAQQIAAIKSALLQEQRLATEVTRGTRKVGVRKKKINAGLKAVQALVDQGNQSTSLFPDEVTVCANFSCDKIDRAIDLQRIRDAVAGLDAQVQKAVKQMRRAQKKARLKAAKAGRTSTATVRKVNEAIGQLPSSINQCPTAVG